MELDSTTPAGVLAERGVPQKEPAVAEPNTPPATDISTALRLAEFARGLHTKAVTVEDMMGDMLVRSLDLLADADSGCVTTLRRGARTVVAATDPLSAELCRRQYELGEGPIDNELWRTDTVVSEDLDNEGRWPAFASAATEAGIRSLAAFRLYTDGGDLGALVFYSAKPNAFSTTDVIVGESMAAHAAIALLSARNRTQFETALASRDLIGQAKGMLMERFDIDAIRAFDLLVRLSQERNEPLHLVAGSVVEAEHPITSITGCE